MRRALCAEGRARAPAALTLCSSTTAHGPWERTPGRPGCLAAPSLRRCDPKTLDPETLHPKGKVAAPLGLGERCEADAW